MRIAGIVPGTELNGGDAVVLELGQNVIERQLGQKSGKYSNFHVDLLEVRL
jgi:hypothetical protein